MPEVRLTMEEYQALLRMQSSGRESEGARLADRRAKPKRKGRPDPKMAKALKKANEMGRTKSGKLRKGYDQARIMRTAHKLRRKM
tara:strand:+ start:790 stop:1044 length:255 start_codon:yes stop_codon:yes gene_type:complete